MNYKDQMAAVYIDAQTQAQDRCRHRKGGSVFAFPDGGADDHSVIKHYLPSGGLMVRCTRCGKEWHPINFPDRTPATPGWETAITLETTNVTSGGVTFPTSEVSAHQQIENWIYSMVRNLNDSVRYAGKISKLEKKMSSMYSTPEKFYDRIKLALRILRGN